MLYSKTLKALKFAALLFCLIFIASCVSKSAFVKKSFFAMDTYMEVTVYGEDAEIIASLCEEKVFELDGVFSAENGNVARLNDGKTVNAPRELFDVISESVLYKDLTEGYFDVTVRPLIELWGFNSDEKRVPTEEEISNALAFVGSEKITLREGNVYLGETTIDLGAVAKGYTSGTLRDICIKHGANSALIYLGGNVRTVGRKPDGSLWNIGIKDPENSSRIVGTVKVYDKAVITSGAYQRYFISDGKIYHHILDPHTGKPSESGLVSVTIISDNDVLADVFSTAIFAGGKQLAEKLYVESGNFEYILIDGERNVTVSDGIADTFTLTNNSYKF